MLVRALRTLGADVDWYLPSRIDDGYGLALATVERLAARGTELLVTVDCAITAVDEVAAARAAGLDVVVTDHHTPRADGRLPDAPIVHPGVGGYPCPELCAAGVAYKLAARCSRRAGLDPARGRRRPRPRRARHGRRLRPARGREPAPRPRRPARAGVDAQARPAGADGRRARGPERRRRGRDRLPARAADQRGGAAAPRRRRPRAAAHRRRRPGRGDRRGARRGQHASAATSRRRSCSRRRPQAAEHRAAAGASRRRTCSPARAGTRA